MKKYKILNKIKNSKSVCLVSHLDPDPDAIASMVVFQEFIKQKFKIKTVDIFSECENFSSNLKEIIENSNINNEPKQYELAIMLDCPNSKRLGIYENLYLSAKQKIVIDHHTTNNFSGDINIVEICSSTCEIIFSILQEFKFNLSKTSMGKLYSGIITDTNNFSVGEMSSRTFDVVSKIIPHIKQEIIYKTFLANATLKNKQLEALAIRNLKTYQNDQILISYISHEEANMFKFDTNDYMGVINNLAKINSAKLICLIQSRNNQYYVSMRAKSNLDVSQIAKNNGGGGHVGAAAFNSNLDIESIKKIVLNSFIEELKNLIDIKQKIF